MKFLFPCALSVPALALVLTSVLACCPAAQAKERVRQFSGDRSAETAEFEVEAPWLIDWRVNSEYPQLLGIAVSLIDAETGTHEGYVLKTKQRGNGLRLMDQSGRFRFSVDASLADWTLKVEQLTRQEAEQYQPPERDQRGR
ncbi:MAG: hypothetical protein RQ826_01245 [Xanthomonadales bacterium]|nr:hypothetical protein [Xanthomonadales bacterium]